jgi:hypothetical protein
MEYMGLQKPTIKSGLRKNIIMNLSSAEGDMKENLSSVLKEINTELFHKFNRERQSTLEYSTDTILSKNTTLDRDFIDFQ